MKVYVDSVPFCDNCPCRDEYFCKLIEKDVFDEFYSIDDKNGIHKECPIKHISDYTKQVRKEVCEEIKKKADIEFERCRYENYITGEDTLIRRKLYRIDEEKLDQIQGVEDGRLD